MERLRKRSVVDANGCWIWQGHTNANGYGEAGWQNRTWRAHRLAYLAAYGDFDWRLLVCHRCDVRRCVNPAHLFLGDNGANIRDAVEKKRHTLAAKTQCYRGHPLSGDNVLYSDNKLNGRKRRQCKACNRGRQRVAAGWPEALAYTLDVVPHGHIVMQGDWSFQGRITDSQKEPQS